jgi:hypothetical protein
VSERITIHKETVESNGDSNNNKTKIVENNECINSNGNAKEQKTRILK